MVPKTKVTLNSIEVVGSLFLAWIGAKDPVVSSLLTVGTKFEAVGAMHRF